VVTAAADKVAFWDASEGSCWKSQRTPSLMPTPLAHAREGEVTVTVRFIRFTDGEEAARREIGDRPRFDCAMPSRMTHAKPSMFFRGAGTSRHS
jgi:hypothetical protein